MANKRFMERLAAIGKSADRVSLLAHDVCIEAVKAIYANQDQELVELVLNSELVPEFVRKAAASWFRKFGVNVDAPLPGSKLYRVDGVINPKRQADVFGKIATTPVLTMEHKETRVKQDKPLEGTPEKRAADAVAALVKRLKEKDAAGAAALNDQFTRNGPQPLTVVGAEGSVFRIEAEEYDAIVALIHKRRTQS